MKRQRQQEPLLVRIINILKTSFFPICQEWNYRVNYAPYYRPFWILEMHVTEAGSA